MPAGRVSAPCPALPEICGIELPRWRKSRVLRWVVFFDLLLEHALCLSGLSVSYVASSYAKTEALWPPDMCWDPLCDAPSRRRPEVRREGHTAVVHLGLSCSDALWCAAYRCGDCCMIPCGSDTGTTFLFMARRNASDNMTDLSLISCVTVTEFFSLSRKKGLA